MLFSFALSFTVAAAAVWLMLRSRLATLGLDQPNHRSLHTRPTPRIGGLGLLVGSAAAVLLSASGALPAGVWLALGLLVAVSVIDDLRGLTAAIRLPLHLTAAAIAATAALPAAEWLPLVAVTLGFGWLINLYNFMDGSDGLAGGQALFGFGALALAAALAGDAGIATTAAAIAGAAAGFLVFNLPPARIFMGDTGSTALGLLAGALGAVGVERGLWSPLIPVLAFLPFIFDASATLAVRLARGRRVWEAHREHAYQRLNLSGFGHRRTAIAYYLLMATCATAALAARSPGAQLTALAFLVAVFVVLYAVVQRFWQRRHPIGSDRRPAASKPRP